MARMQWLPSFDWYLPVMNSYIENRMIHSIDHSFSFKPMVVSEYSVILIALMFDMCLGAALLGISLAIAQSQGVCLNYSKVSSFECGFLNFSDARQKFNINFYLVGILFVIFDIEVTVLFP